MSRPFVNTSFNVRGEPIACTPEDAFCCFMGSDIEVLVTGKCFLRKEEQDPALRRDHKNAFELDWRRTAPTTTDAPAGSVVRPYATGLAVRREGPVGFASPLHDRARTSGGRRERTTRPRLSGRLRARSTAKAT
jgi:Carbamoyltransferase C-terminus